MASEQRVGGTGRNVPGLQFPTSHWECLAHGARRGTGSPCFGPATPELSVTTDSDRAAPPTCPNVPQLWLDNLPPPLFGTTEAGHSWL